MGKIKFIFAIPACIFVGVLMLVGPEDMRKEIPDLWRVGLGWSFIGFGLLMLATFFSVRAKALAVLVATGLLSGLCLYGTVPPGLEAWALSSRGQVTQAQVVRSATQIRGKKFTSVQTVAYAGRRGKVTGGGRLQRGSTIQVVFDPDNPETVARGNPGDGFLDYIDRGIGRWPFFGGIVVGLMFGVWVLISLDHLVRGTDISSIDEVDQPTSGAGDSDVVAL